MTNVPGAASNTWSLGPPFTARAETRHRYDVHASSGVVGTNAVSFTAFWRSTCPVRVLMISITYCHGPGGRVIAGLLHTNRGLLLNTTLLLAAMGSTRRNQLRTVKESIVCWRTTPPASMTRARK